LCWSQWSRRAADFHTLGWRVRVDDLLCTGQPCVREQLAHMCGCIQLCVDVCMAMDEARFGAPQMLRVNHSMLRVDLRAGA